MEVSIFEAAAIGNRVPPKLDISGYDVKELAEKLREEIIICLQRKDFTKILSLHRDFTM